MGGKDQQPAAYSPETGHFYVPFSNLCMNLEGIAVNYTPGIPYVGATVRTFIGPEGHMGSFAAWDPVAGEKVWEIEERFSVWSGVLATGGDLAFYGTLDGWFRAVDVATGDVLWELQLGSGIVGAPITYIGPDGRQYVAVFSGVGGWPGVVVAGDMRTDDPHAALGAANAFAALKNYTSRGGALHVFALPDEGADGSRPSQE
jgi:glucose dehydrogenase